MGHIKPLVDFVRYGDHLRVDGVRSNPRHDLHNLFTKLIAKDSVKAIEISAICIRGEDELLTIDEVGLPYPSHLEEWMNYTGMSNDDLHRSIVYVLKEVNSNEQIRTELTNLTDSGIDLHHYAHLVIPIGGSYCYWSYQGTKI